MGRHRDEQWRRIRLGLACAALTAAAASLIEGRQGVVSAATMSVVATGMQLLAARVMWRTGVAPTVDQLRVYGVGVGMRMLGVAVMAALLTGFPLVFVLASSAIGYLGTVLPLLYLEIRLGR